jgi:Ras-related protein Rab-7A
VPLDRGPKLFLASAKTGQSVPIIFEYIAKRVVMRWEWEDTVQERMFEYTERLSDIRLTQPNKSRDRSWASTCCL